MIAEAAGYHEHARALDDALVYQPLDVRLRSVQTKVEFLVVECGQRNEDALQFVPS